MEAYGGGSFGGGGGVTGGGDDGGGRIVVPETKEVKESAYEKCKGDKVEIG